LRWCHRLTGRRHKSRTGSRCRRDVSRIQCLRAAFDRLQGEREILRSSDFKRVDLVALAPQVILANSSQAVAALLQATRTVPIVFVSLPDPVGAGFGPVSY